VLSPPLWCCSTPSLVRLIASSLSLRAAIRTTRILDPFIPLQIVGRCVAESRRRLRLRWARQALCSASTSFVPREFGRRSGKLPTIAQMSIRSFIRTFWHWTFFFRPSAQGKIALTILISTPADGLTLCYFVFLW